MQIRWGRILKKIWYRIRISRESLTEYLDNKLWRPAERGVKLGHSVPVPVIPRVAKQKVLARSVQGQRAGGDTAATLLWSKYFSWPHAGARAGPGICVEGSLQRTVGWGGRRSGED